MNVSGRSNSVDNAATVQTKNEKKNGKSVYSTVEITFPRENIRDVHSARE